MGPRKRFRPNPPPNRDSPVPSSKQTNEVSATTTNAKTDADMSKSPTSSVAPSVADSTTSSTRYAKFRNSKTKTRSWYGSWPRMPKSEASTQVARETIQGGTVKSKGAPDFSRFDTRRLGELVDGTAGVGDSDSERSAPSLRRSAAPRRPPISLLTESLEAAATTATVTPTTVTATATATATTPGTETETTASSTPKTTAINPPASGPVSGGAPTVPAADPPLSHAEMSVPTTTDTAQPDAAVAPTDQTLLPEQKEQNSSSAATAATAAPPAGWMSWLSKSRPPAPQQEADMKPTEAEPPKEEDTTLASTGPEQEIVPLSESTRPTAEQETAETATIMTTATKASVSMWSYFWPGGPSEAPPTTDDKDKDKDVQMADAPDAKETNDGSDDVVMNDAPSEPIPVPAASKAASIAPSMASATNSAAGTPSGGAGTASVGSTWAFWSRDSRAKSLGKSVSPEQGEMAVIGERSEANPKAVSRLEVKEGKAKESKNKESKEADGKANGKANGNNGKASGKGSGKDNGKSKAKEPETIDTNKKSRTDVMDIDEAATSALEAATEAVASRPNSAGKGDANKNKTSSKADKTKDKTPAPPNLLLPSFESTYSVKESPSMLRQLAQLMWRSPLLSSSSTPSSSSSACNHVFRTRDPPRIHKAVAIGVHGLFPAAYLRPMIGQPTGTSIRFANHAAEAVRRWADAHGCGDDCEIEKIALEGEGKIGERVDNLWKLLLNWQDHIREADFVLLTCHSQGVPVGLMLLAKLLDLGIITTTARVGVCAMAGVSLGPFPEYKSGLGILMGSAGELWEFSKPDSDVSKRYAHALTTVLDHGCRITYVGSIDDQLVPLESAIFSPVHHPYVYRAVFVDGRIHAPDFIANLIGFACKLRNLGISDHGLIRELSVPLAGSLYSGEGHSRLYDDPRVYDLALAHALETADVTPPCSGCTITRHPGMASANTNPYHLPWIMRGLLEEDFVKTSLQSETTELLRQFDDWKPVTKALKDVKYRLEAIRSKL